MGIYCTYWSDLFWPALFYSNISLGDWRDAQGHPCGASQAMKRSANSVAEDLLAIHLGELRLRFDRQVPVCAERKWRLDFTLPDFGVALEIDGYFKGRHGAGWGADNEKRNTATMLGWRVLTFSTTSVECGNAKEFLRQWIGPARRC